MLLTRIVGLYVARIHAEVKRRPLYIVAEAHGFDAATRAVERVTGVPTFAGHERGAGPLTARQSA
jgi:polyisoprenyl-phosphate glycosyltransferase